MQIRFSMVELPHCCFPVGGGTGGWGAGEEDLWLLRLDEDVDLPGASFARTTTAVASDTSWSAVDASPSAREAEHQRGGHPGGGRGHQGYQQPPAPLAPRRSGGLPRRLGLPAAGPVRPLAAAHRHCLRGSARWRHRSGLLRAPCGRVEEGADHATAAHGRLRGSRPGLHRSRDRSP